MNHFNRSLLVVVLTLLASAARANEPLKLTLSKLKDVELRLYGFVETDLYADTRQAFNESQANLLLPKDGTYAGTHHRTQMSLRQSRIGFDFILPKTDSGLLAETIIELDFTGNNAPNTTPGTAPGSQTERDFFNNPAVRVRHAYGNFTKDEWNLKVGQYWGLFGWGADYFPPEPSVQATPGHTGSRHPQIRLTRAHPFSDAFVLTGAASLSRPAEMNSGSPVPELAFKLSSPRYSADFIAGPARTMAPASISGTWMAIPIQTAGAGNPTGQAVAISAFLPIIPSKDAKDRANNLAFVGQVVAGDGVGGLELGAASAGVPAVTAASAGTAIDSGLAGINLSGNVELVRFRSFRGALTYTLPAPEWTVAAGYAQVECRNLDRFGTTAAVTANLSPKQQFGYASLFYEPLNWLRLAASVSQTRDTYNDASARFANNNRLQLTSFFLF